MRIDYTQYPLIDSFKNVRYITESFCDCMRKCEDKIQEYAFCFDSCEVCYLYLGMLIHCKFISVEGWIESAHLQCFYKREKGYDYVFNKGNENKLSEQEKTLLFLAASFTFFIEHAEVETIHLNKQSGISHLNIKYQNATKKNVKIFDSKWIRTIVMGESFNVRGHFRMQPCGDARGKRKLIWINDFQKEGYTRIAGKVLEKGGNHE
jgi:hypothetical protein